MDSLASSTSTTTNAARAVAALAPNDNISNTVHVTTDLPADAERQLSSPQSPLSGRGSRGCWPWSRATKYKIGGILLAAAAVAALIYSGVHYHTDFKNWFQQ